MEDIPEHEDNEPRTGEADHQALLRSAPFLLFSFPGDLPELIPVFLLLLLALVCSVLRASLSASASFEAPWDKKSNVKKPGKEERFTLLIVQYCSMLAAWIMAADVFLGIFTDHRAALYAFAGLVSAWLVTDAILRWYGGRDAVALSERLLPFVGPVLSLLRPVGAFFLNTAVMLGVSKKESVDTVSSQPDGEESDAIEEKELLLGVAAMGRTTAREAMVSKSAIRAFSIGLDFHELMDMVNKSGYSRTPVFRDNLDNIEGILYIKDLLPYIQEDERFAWQKLVRKPYLIPETKRLDSLLEEFQKRRVHMAIVIDEYGSTRGLITLEDIIEEIFGDINDEHDDENESSFVRLDDQNYLFEGQALLNDVIRALDLDSDYFSESRTESETLAGLILELFTRVPRHGEEIVFKDLTFKIQSATKKQVKKIRVTLP